MKSPTMWTVLVATSLFISTSSAQKRRCVSIVFVYPCKTLLAACSWSSFKLYNKCALRSQAESP